MEEQSCLGESLKFYCFFILAFGWGLHFHDVDLNYGLTSSNASYTLLVVIAIITACSTSLLGDKISYYIFISTLSGMVTFSYLNLNFTNGFIILNIFLFLLFSISNYKLSQMQLKDLVSSQVRITKEKDRLTDIINTVPGFVGLVDKNLTFYMANKATIALYPQIIGKKLGNLDPHSDWESIIVDFMKSSKTADLYEAKSKIKGEEIYALLNFQKMSDGGLILVSIITTELALAQKKLREQELRTIYSAKLASLGEMAAGIAHEVNNPLTIIQGSANIVGKLVEQEPINVASIKMFTAKMIDTTERISKIIRSLKALSRNGENDSKEWFPLTNVFNQCFDISLQRFKQHGIDLKSVEIDSDLLFYGREFQLCQVLINLINNSVDAIKDLDDKWIKISAKIDDNFLEFLVVDSGTGIPEHLHAKIMDPFFTTKNVNQGTGLGLSISKSIIHDHGGELNLLTTSSNTTFRMRFSSGFKIKEVLI